MIFLLAQLVVALAILFLFLGSVADLRTGEIPEKISYGFIASMIMIAASSSVIESDPGYILNSFMAGLGFFLVGLLLFYLGQWGGGDVKLVTGIGCCLGYMSFQQMILIGFFPYYLSYFLNLIALAFPYAAAYGLWLGRRSPETGREFRKYIGDIKTKALLAASFIPMLLALYYGMNGLAVLYTLLPVMTLTALYLKAVELKALQETVPLERLKAGDVVAEDLLYEGRKIASKRDIEGITEKDLKEIRKLAEEGKIAKEIRIKRGIKFVPVLFFAFLSLVFFGNFIELLMPLL